MTIRDFVRESNRIEGILRHPLDHEIEAHAIVLRRSDILIADLVEFVSAVQPGAVLRDQTGLDVRVGDHIAPRGGMGIVCALSELLLAANNDSDTPFNLHRAYETLHPFTDGNGRSGRAVWLWMMMQRGELEVALARGFLHSWYYQSLEADDARAIQAHGAGAVETAS